MGILSDGSCAPSWLGIGTFEDGLGAVSSLLNDNTALHMGFTTNIHYPGDKGYEGAKEVLYDVTVPMSLGSGGVAWVTFENVRWGAGYFGGKEDFTRARLRVPKGYVKGTNLTIDIVNQASYVAILCDNGRSQNAYIVGLAEHPYVEQDSKELGYYHKQVFNGVSSLIDKDGQWSVTFTGAILDSESNAFIEPPEDTTGTTILMDKTGSVLLDDVKGESIKLDKPNKLIKVSARTMTTDVTEGNHSTTAKGKVTFLASGNAVFNGKKVYVGKEGASDPLVLGNKLTQALQELLAYFNGPIGALGAIPIMVHPTFKGNLMKWQAQYAVPNVSPFLSRKGFVE